MGHYSGIGNGNLTNNSNDLSWGHSEANKNNISFTDFDQQKFFPSSATNSASVQLGANNSFRF